METEVIYADGSLSTFTVDGGSFHDGHLAIERLRLIAARRAIKMYVETGMQLTRNGWQSAIQNVVEPLTGKTYKRSKQGRIAALHDIEHLLWLIEGQAVAWSEDE